MNSSGSGDGEVAGALEYGFIQSGELHEQLLDSEGRLCSTCFGSSFSIPETNNLNDFQNLRNKSQNTEFLVNQFSDYSHFKLSQLRIRNERMN
jgi:hypothetical protein